MIADHSDASIFVLYVSRPPIASRVSVQHHRNASYGRCLTEVEHDVCDNTPINSFFNLTLTSFYNIASHIQTADAFALVLIISFPIYSFLNGTILQVHAHKMH